MSNNDRWSRHKKIAIYLGVIIPILAIVVSIIVWRCPYPPPTSDFSVSVDPMDGVVQQDGVIQTTVTVKGIHGYEYNISLSASGQPSDVVITFAPPMGGPKPAFTSNVLVNVGSNVPIGSYEITIKGIGADGKEHSCNYILTVIPPPPPEIEITYPHDNDTVEISETVEGTSQNIPEGQVIWIVVYPHPVDRYYPYNDPADIQVNGEWASLVVIGVEEDAGMKFDIIAVLADESAQDTFDAYLKQAEATNNWSGLDAIPSGAVIYGRVTVTRK